MIRRKNRRSSRSSRSRYIRARYARLPLTYVGSFYSLSFLKRLALKITENKEGECDEWDLGCGNHKIETIPSNISAFGLLSNLPSPHGPWDTSMCTLVHHTELQTNALQLYSFLQTLRLQEPKVDQVAWLLSNRTHLYENTSKYAASRIDAIVTGKVMSLDLLDFMLLGVLGNFPVVMMHGNPIIFDDVFHELPERLRISRWRPPAFQQGQPHPKTLFIRKIREKLSIFRIV